MHIISRINDQSSLLLPVLAILGTSLKRVYNEYYKSHKLYDQGLPLSQLVLAILGTSRIYIISHIYDQRSQLLLV